MWLKFGVLSKGLFSHLKAEQMKVEVENLDKVENYTTFFSKKKYWHFQKKGFANNLAKVGRKDFFLYL